MLSAEREDVGRIYSGSVNLNEELAGFGLWLGESLKREALSIKLVDDNSLLVLFLHG